jgi:hypothetical protein
LSWLVLTRENIKHGYLCRPIEAGYFDKSFAPVKSKAARLDLDRSEPESAFPIVGRHGYAAGTMEEPLSVEPAVAGAGSPPPELGVLRTSSAPMTAAEFAKMKGSGTGKYKNSAKWEAAYYGVIGSRSIKNIRTNLPFPSASSRT